MKNVKIITPTIFYNTSRYQHVEDGIYNDLNDVDGFSTYRIAITIKHETTCSNTVEKELETYFVYIEKDLGFTENKTQKIILGGELEDLQKFKSMIK